jgi:hypothetical protein
MGRCFSLGAHFYIWEVLKERESDISRVLLRIKSFQVFFARVILFRIGPEENLKIQNKCSNVIMA